MKNILFLLTMAASMTSFASNKVLIIVSAATEMTLANGKNHSTGYFLGELT
jgi:hypothetical protein